MSLTETDLVCLTGDCLYYPTPPTLGGGLKPTEWLKSIADIDEKRGATARAREAREIAEWLGRMARWARREIYEPAPLPASAMSTGTAKTPKAVEGRSPASAVPKADAQSIAQTTPPPPVSED